MLAGLALLAITTVGYAEGLAAPPTDAAASLTPPNGSLYKTELISGAGSYSYSRVAVQDELSGSEYILATTRIGLNVSWSRFVTAHTTFGGSLSSSDLIQKISHTVLTEDDQFWFGPRIGYYWGDRATRFLPYAAAECDFLAHQHDAAKEPVIGFKLGGGVIVRPYPGFGIVLDVSYRKTTMKSDLNAIVFDLGLAGLIF